MTVAELRQRMSGYEFTRWMVFLNEKNRREASAMRKARSHNRAMQQAKGH